MNCKNMIARAELKTVIHDSYIPLLITAGLFSLMSHGLAMVCADLTLLTAGIIFLALYVIRVRKGAEWTDWRYFRMGLPIFLERGFPYYSFEAFFILGPYVLLMSMVPTLMISNITQFFFGHHVVRAHMLLIFAGSFVSAFALFCINHAYVLGRDDVDCASTDSSTTTVGAS